MTQAKSTHMHILEGTFRTDRHGPPALKKIKAPKPPAWLSVEAKKKFRETAKLLADNGIMTALDVDTLANFATTWTTWRQASDMVEESGLLITHGELIKPNPAVIIAQTAARDLQALANTLGLSPAARRRMRIDLTADDQHQGGVCTRDRSQGPPPPDSAGKVG